MPSRTKFKLSNFDVKHAIVILNHAIVQLKYKISNGMFDFILLFNMKPFIRLFKASMHYVTMAFTFEGHSTIVMFNSMQNRNEERPSLGSCRQTFPCLPWAS